MLNMQKFILTSESYSAWRCGSILQASTGRIIDLEEALNIAMISLPHTCDYDNDSDYEYDCLRSMSSLVDYGLYPHDFMYYEVNNLEENCGYMTHRMPGGSVVVVLVEYYE